MNPFVDEKELEAIRKGQAKVVLYLGNPPGPEEKYFKLAQAVDRFMQDEHGLMIDWTKLAKRLVEEEAMRANAEGAKEHGKD